MRSAVPDSRIDYCGQAPACVDIKRCSLLAADSTPIPAAHCHASICCRQVSGGSPSPSAFSYVGRVAGEIGSTAPYSSFLNLKNLHIFRLFVFKTPPLFSCFPNEIWLISLQQKWTCGKKISMVSHEAIF